MLTNYILSPLAQWGEATEFQVVPVKNYGWLKAMADLLVCLIALLVTKAIPPAKINEPEKVIELEKPPIKPIIEVDKPLFLTLCNNLFRLRSNVQVIIKGGGETKEVRNVNRALTRIEEDLKDRGFEYFDKTGKPFYADDQEFEPKGQPIPVAGINLSRIGPCELPVVKLRGEIIQRAQGLVEVPAKQN